MFEKSGYHFESHLNHPNSSATSKQEPENPETFKADIAAGPSRALRLKRAIGSSDDRPATSAACWM